MGRELYYVTRDYVLVAVPVDYRGSEIKFGAPRRLFPLDLRTRPTYGRYVYAASASGDRFYVMKKISDPVEMPLNVILNATFSLAEKK